MSRPTLARWKLGHLLGDSPRGRIWLATDDTFDVVLWELTGAGVAQSDAERRLEQLCARWTGAPTPWLAPSLEYGAQPLITMPYFASVGFGELCRASLFAGIETALALQSVLALTETLLRSPDLADSFATLVTGSTVRIGFDGEVRAGPDPLRALEAWDDGLRLDPMVPPELFDRGAASPKSVVWKLGLFAVYALEGGDPFRDDPNYWSRPVRARPRLTREAKAQWPASLAELLDAAISPKPAERPTLYELGDRLRAHAGAAAEAAHFRAEAIRKVRPEAEPTQRLQLDALHDRPLDPLPAELEEKLLAGPDAGDVWRVVGDWLESQGHARGQLAALQRKLHEQTTDEALEKLVDRLVLRSDLAPQPAEEGPFELEWGHHGWVEELLGLGPMDAWSIERVLRHPGLRYLRRVALPLHHADPEPWVAALTKVCPPLLKTLELTKVTLDQKVRLTEALHGLTIVVRKPPPQTRPGRPPRINLGAAPPQGLFTRFIERLRGR